MYSKVALSIGGSDSGGGAGIQADLRTFMALKVHGCTAITCVTAQNSISVKSVDAIEINNINDQIDQLFSDFPIKSLKTGMLLNENIIKATAKTIQNQDVSKIIDPVMVSRTGAKLLEQNAINAYKEYLFPQADLITPNIFEANLLTDMDIKCQKDIEESGKILKDYGANAVLIKGGGLNDLKGKDFFIDKNGQQSWLSHEFVDTNNTHGSGCTLSAAICGYRALGLDLLDAIIKAKAFIEKSMVKAYQIGSGPGPLCHYQ